MNWLSGFAQTCKLVRAGKWRRPDFLVKVISLNLVADYRQQFGWRPWRSIFDALPRLRGQTVLDLGCGIGDQAAEFVARGAYVIGVDANEQLIDEAKSRGLQNAEFLSCDLRKMSDLNVMADGIWSSFTAAYFTDLPAMLESWGQYLRPDGWMALTEVDDLFGHEPLSTRTKSLLKAYAEDGLAAGRYDFNMGGKLQCYLERSGYVVSEALRLPDKELSFHGPADPEVTRAWRNRFDRMTLLHNFCASEFEEVREEFLSCLARPDHRCSASLCFCLATKDSVSKARSD